MKRPAFQFYPADWRKDAALQLCSISARGLWWEMICLMHEAVPYGHLVAAGKPVTVAGLSRLVGEPVRDVQKWLAELQSADVFSTTETGIIFCRRMVRDETARRAWRERQERHREKAGEIDRDEPRDDDRDDQRDIARDVTLPVTAMSLLSSSSSSSSTSVNTQNHLGISPGVPPAPPPERVNGNHAKRATRLPEDWRLPDDWRDWATRVHHVEPQRAVRISLSFRDYWCAKPGKDATKLDWFATWRQWIRKEVGDA